MPTFASSEFWPQPGMVNPEKLVYFGLAPLDAAIPKISRFPA